MHEVAIIGGGASGVLTALHLLETQPDVQITLIESEAGKLARGVAYSTESEHHLLNVRAFGMSAWQTRPNDFVEWLQRTFGDRYTPNDFVPRRHFGRYLSESLAAADSGRLRTVIQEATNLIPNGPEWRITLADGTELAAETVILTLGNFPPQSLRPFTESGIQPPLYFENPWAAPLDLLIQRPSICLIGTGLTSVDIVIDLLQRGYQGQISAISRNGLMPMFHVDPGAPADPCPPLGSEVAAQARAFRRWLKSDGTPWQVAFDSVRPEIQSWWRGLDLVQQRRFLHRLRTMWDVHRHRIDPHLHDLLTTAMRRGQFRIYAGAIQGVSAVEDATRIEVRPKSGEAPFAIEAATILNCTGPSADIRRVRSEFVRNVLSAGIVHTDDHHLGFATDDDGHLLDSQNRPYANLYAVGPLRKGTLWESTAMREIREQAHALATRDLNPTS